MTSSVAVFGRVSSVLYLNFVTVSPLLRAIPWNSIETKAVQYVDENRRRPQNYFLLYSNLYRIHSDKVQTVSQRVLSAKTGLVKTNLRFRIPYT